MRKTGNEKGIYFSRLDQIISHIPSHCQECQYKTPLEKTKPTGKFIVTKPRSAFVGDTTVFSSVKHAELHGLIFSNFVDAFSKMAWSYLVSQTKN